MGQSTRHAILRALAAPTLLAAASCGSSTPTQPDTRAPFVGWVVPAVTAGDTVFVFTHDTTSVRLNAGDDGGVITRVQVFLDGLPVATLTSAPYIALLDISGIRNNRSARVWATASDPTGKVGATVDTLRFVRSALPDTATWTELAPSRRPVARDGFTLVVDVPSDRALLFGGYAFATFSSLSDLWSFDLVTNQWDSLAPTGTPPLSRTYHGAGVAAGLMLVAGGEHIEGAADSVLEDYALLDLNALAWNSGLFDFGLRPTMAMASATVGTNVYLFGGVNAPAASAHDSLRRYNLATDQWQSLSTTNPLTGPRALALAAGNLEDDVLFVYGGTSGSVADPPSGRSNYRLNLGTLAWTSTAAPGPPALANGGAIYDSAEHRILLWGGRDAAGAYPVEVWEFSLGAFSWRQVPTVGTPPAGRAGHRLIYDAARRRLVLFGGKVGLAWNDETWQLAW